MDVKIEELTKQLEILTRRVDYLESRLRYHINYMNSTVHKMGHDYF